MNTMERRWVCGGCEVCVTTEFIEGDPADPATECGNCLATNAFKEVFTRDQIEAAFREWCRLGEERWSDGETEHMMQNPQNYAEQFTNKLCRLMERVDNDGEGE